ncbi:MAG: hypothetical protein FWH02_05930 [Oscillospiraceae bacterium]|nr:hypothetical protein [Oscillospiraceae bacterium]
MRPYSIYIAFISWGGGGKRRPVLVLSEADGFVSVFRITSQFAGKSPGIQAHYLEIIDRQQAGLDKQSYIDTGKIVELPIKSIITSNPIGHLSAEDERRLAHFLGVAQMAFERT